MPITAQISGLTYGGAFIGKITEGDAASIGKKIFVRGAAQGETITAEITADKKSFSEATLLSVISPSPARMTPPCPYYEKCGGCDLQHLTLAAQREAKREMVEATLRFQAKMSAKKGVTLIGKDLPGFDYRRRIALHLNEQGELGFYQPNSDSIVPIERCLLASDLINEAIPRLTQFIPAISKRVGGIVLEEHDNGLFVLLELREDRSYVLLPEDLRDELLVQFKNLELSYRGEIVFSARDPNNSSSADTLPIGHFSQVNVEANDILVRTVVEKVTSKEVTDLYAGSGNFSIPLAKAGVRVDAVEMDEALVRHGEALAITLSVERNVRFFASSCEQFIRNNKFRSTIVLDPPRAGAKNIVDAFKDSAIKEVIYVSCSLPSLCRDIKILESLKFELIEVLVLDMFPQTHHVETISVLGRVRSPSGPGVGRVSGVSN